MSTQNKPKKDPRGHSLRIYGEVFDSPAFQALSPVDVRVYLALLRELHATNNGALSLTLTRAKTRGINNHQSIARSLRALCAVGLVAITRKGGGRHLPTLYRMTDRECHAIPAKMLAAINATNEWRNVTSVQHGHELIEAAEKEAGNAAQKQKA